jgi:predicted dehydrogenase
VWEKVRRDGFFSALEVIQNRLDTPVNLGYSSAGTIIAVDKGIDNFRVGDRVACAGTGYANHAEVVFVPQNLASRLPEEVDFESGSFSTLGAIALQGLRLAEVELGGTVAVIGLGLIGLLTVQLAKAAGCQVAAMDPNPARAEIASQMGADAVALNRKELLSVVSRLSLNHGADAVLITAASGSDEPVILAGEVARDRAIVVAVGAVGMDIPRRTYYGKELTFRVSRSYGPGRYDPEYEEKGKDYPIGYVRWTERRNMEAFLQLLAGGKVKVQPLITHRFPITEALQAYDLILGKNGEPSLGILLTYPEQSASETKTFYQSSGIVVSPRPSVVGPRSSILKPVTVGLLGAGQFATSILLPAMKKVTGIEFMGVCAASGISAAHAGKKFAFHFATTDENEIVQNPAINTIVIATRHHLHARQVIAALKAGKDVFVEKPLCLNENELEEIIRTYSALRTPHSEFDLAHSNDSGHCTGARPCAPTLNSDLRDPPASLLPRASNFEPRIPLLMVGFNRRFAPMARRLKDFVAQIGEPLMMHYRINAGYIPVDHWVQDPEQGGGRIIGEVCHFLDFLIFLAGSLPQKVYSKALPNNSLYRDDNLSITIEFENGSLGTITYVANGDKRFPKERVEVFGGGATAGLDNFRRLELVQKGHRQVFRSWLQQDKGHRGEWEAFTKAIRAGSVPLIPFEEIASSAFATFKILESMHPRRPIKIHEPLEIKTNEKCPSINL